MNGKAIPMQMVTATPSGVPPSFAGDMQLYGMNLFLMTTMFFLAFMLAWRQGSRIWEQRIHDHPLDPVSLYRLLTMLAAGAAMLRCGGEAMLLWGWNPHDPETTARVVMAKRWIDPIALMMGALWMGIVVLGEPGLEHQLRKAPLPVDMWSRWPMLVRAAGVVCLSFVAALAAVILR